MAWVVIGESFPLRTRAKQASIATAGNWLGNCELLTFRDIGTTQIMCHTILCTVMIRQRTRPHTIY